MALDIFITLLFVALNGFFVAAEFALVKVRGSQIESKVRSGDRQAIATKHIIEHMDAYLSACQLGITLASLALGWIGEGVVASLFIRLFDALNLNLSETAAHGIALPISFVFITTLHIVLGEQAPKYLGIKRSESTALATALPLRWFYFLFKPFIYVLNKMSNWVMKLIGVDSSAHHEVHTPQELLFLLEESRSGGTITASEHTMVANVFDFYDRHTKQVMRHRTSIVGVNKSWPPEKILTLIAGERFTRYPVYEESIDNIVGIVHVKDILNAVSSREEIDIDKLIKPVFFVPDTKPIGKLLRDFQNKHLHLAIVIDEFGGVSGIITLEDIIEELVGEIQDEYDTEAPWVVKQEDGSYLIQAVSNIIDANEQLPLPLPEGEDYETVGGYMNLLFGKVPDVGSTVETKDYIFEIIEKTEYHVERVKATVKHEMHSKPEE